jgi:hypothetical protein
MLAQTGLRQRRAGEEACLNAAIAAAGQQPITASGQVAVQ